MHSRIPPQRVLVTGAGGPAGIAVIKELKAQGHFTVGADADPLAAGLFLADDSFVVPPYRDADYAQLLCEAAAERSVTLLVSTLAEELEYLTHASTMLSEAGIAHWFSKPDSVARCVDKWLFATALEGSGVSVPASALGSPGDVPGPWIVKPRFGRGSRDVYAVEDREELAWVLKRVPEPVVQTRLTGREFTVDALTDRSGRLVGAVPRWRLETKAGISTKGETFADVGLSKLVADLLARLDLEGPCNVQGFIDAAGRVSFIEVNPRFSGGLPLSLAAGADLVGQYVRAALGLPIDLERLAYKPGVTMLRHFSEIFVSDPVI